MLLHQVEHGVGRRPFWPQDRGTADAQGKAHAVAEPRPTVRSLFLQSGFFRKSRLFRARDAAAGVGGVGQRAGGVTGRKGGQQQKAEQG